MPLEQIAFLTPILSVLACLLTEKIILKRRLRWSAATPTTVVYAINVALSAGLSLLLLMPLVYLVAPLQVFSFSEWRVPVWLSFSVSFLLLDFVHYASHRLHHALPLLWRLHRLHHSDREVDAFTTVLHHPLEVVTGFIAVVVCAVMVDVPVIVLTTYTLVAGIHSAFTHLNVEVPAKINRILKWIVITPNVHRLHHALDLRDGNSNFGLIFIFWDYAFGTASAGNRPAPAEFGVSEDQAPEPNSIGAYLANPLR